MEPNVEKPVHNKRLLLWVSLVVFGLVIIASAVIWTTTKPKAPASDTAQQPKTETHLKGISMTPRTQDAPGFNEVFAASQELGGALTWSGDWAELGRVQSGAKTLVSSAKKYGYTPVVLVSLHNNKEPATLLRPITVDLTRQYVASAAEFAANNDLEYLGLGIEINNLARSKPADYQAFVGLFNQTYDAVKQASPNTKVFTIFQLERTKGLNGGLFGGVNDTKSNTWSLLNDFAKADIIGFTTYPGLIYKTPSEIPTNYYTEITSHTAKPIVFTEIGWPSASEAKGWDSTPEQQATFVNRFFELAGPVNPQLAIWPFAYDPPATPPFSSVGLANKTGVHRPAWDSWKSAVLK